MAHDPHFTQALAFTHGLNLARNTTNGTVLTEARSESLIDVAYVAGYAGNSLDEGFGAGIDDLPAFTSKEELAAEIESRCALQADGDKPEGIVETVLLILQLAKMLGFLGKVA